MELQASQLSRPDFMSLFAESSHSQLIGARIVMLDFMEAELKEVAGVSRYVNTFRTESAPLLPNASLVVGPINLVFPATTIRPIPTERPQVIGYMSVKRRASTFCQRFDSDVAPQAMAEAGFLFLRDKTGNHSRVQCYWCGTTFDMPNGVDPAAVHLQEAPHCPYIRAKKDCDGDRERAVRVFMQQPECQQYLAAGVEEQLVTEAMEMVYDNRFPFPRGSQMLTLMSMALAKRVATEAPPSDRLACKICLEGKVTVALAPCGHMCACLRCSAQINTCAVCRSSVSARHIVHLE